MVDRIYELEPGRQARGRKAISGSEDFFLDHFPGNPIMPGVLVLEALAQTSGALLAASSNYEKFGLMSFVDNAKFRGFVRPGDMLDLHAEILSADDKTARTTVTASVDGGVVATARLGFVLVPLNTVVPSLYEEHWTRLIKKWIDGHDRTPGAVL